MMIWGEVTGEVGVMAHDHDTVLVVRCAELGIKGTFA